MKNKFFHNEYYSSHVSIDWLIDLERKYTLVKIKAYIHTYMHDKSTKDAQLYSDFVIFFHFMVDVIFYFIF